MEAAKRVLDKGFKFYFAFCLFGFVLLVLLMNIPNALAGETYSEIPKTIPERSIKYQGNMKIPHKFYRWDLQPHNKNEIHESYVEFKGYKVGLKFLF